MEKDFLHEIKSYVWSTCASRHICSPLAIAAIRFLFCSLADAGGAGGPILKCKGGKVNCLVNSCDFNTCPKNPKAVCVMSTCNKPILVPTGKVLKKVGPCDPVFYDEVA